MHTQIVKSSLPYFGKRETKHHIQNLVILLSLSWLKLCSAPPLSVITDIVFY